MQSIKRDEAITQGLFLEDLSFHLTSQQYRKAFYIAVKFSGVFVFSYWSKESILKNGGVTFSFVILTEAIAQTSKGKAILTGKTGLHTEDVVELVIGRIFRGFLPPFDGDEDPKWASHTWRHEERVFTLTINQMQLMPAQKVEGFLGIFEKTFATTNDITITVNGTDFTSVEAAKTTIIEETKAKRPKFCACNTKKKCGAFDKIPKVVTNADSGAVIKNPRRSPQPS